MKYFKKIMIGFASIILTILVFIKIFVSSYALEKLTSLKSPLLISENHAQLLINGVESYSKRLKNLKNAKVVMIKTFEFHDDFTGNQLVAKLEDLAKKGTLIFIQFDVKGNDTYPKDFSSLYHQIKSPIPLFLDKLKKKYSNQVYIFPTNSPKKFYEYFWDNLGIHIPIDHEKYFITWDMKNLSPVRVIIGGMNLGDAYLLSGSLNTHNNHFYKQKNGHYPWRDTDLEITGPVNQLIVKRFLKEAIDQSNMANLYIKKHFGNSMKQGINKLQSILALMNTSKFAFPR